MFVDLFRSVITLVSFWAWSVVVLDKIPHIWTDIVCFCGLSFIHIISFGPIYLYRYIIQRWTRSAYIVSSFKMHCRYIISIITYRGIYPFFCTVNAYSIKYTCPRIICTGVQLNLSLKIITYISLPEQPDNNTAPYTHRSISRFLLESLVPEEEEQNSEFLLDATKWYEIRYIYILMQ